MDRTEESQRGRGSGSEHDVEVSDVSTKPEIEPDSWRDITEFVDQFDDAVFGMLANPDNGAEGFWIVKDIKKVRPAAVPIDQPATFDLSVLGPDGTVTSEIRLIIKEIEHVRAADPKVPRSEGEDKA